MKEILKGMWEFTYTIMFYVSIMAIYILALYVIFDLGI